MSADEPRRPGGKPLVLVVDDDPQVREVLRWALEDAGLAVETAADGAEAVERAVARLPALVVLDITLPTAHGAEVAERLRAACGSDLPILAITADGRAPEKARQAGAYAYLRKPFDPDRLLEQVRVGIRR